MKTKIKLLMEAMAGAGATEAVPGVGAMAGAVAIEAVGETSNSVSSESSNREPTSSLVAVT